MIGMSYATVSFADESWEDERVNEGGITTGSVWKETAVPEYVPKPPPASADTKVSKLFVVSNVLLQIQFNILGL